jgi:hypothetical protein
MRTDRGLCHLDEVLKDSLVGSRLGRYDGVPGCPNGSYLLSGVIGE